MLLTRPVLDRLLRLHACSYSLVKWVSSSLESGKLSFAVVHRTVDSAAAAEEWLRRHYDSLPRESRPDRSELRDFSHLFVSYLSTSFRLPDTPTPRLLHRCCCECCSYLGVAHRLVPLDPTSKDQAQAHRLKLLCLNALAEALGTALTPEKQAAILGNKTLSIELAHLSYAYELNRRTQFASQGTGVLSLWRTIAWEDGRPKRNFTLISSSFGAPAPSAHSGHGDGSYRRNPGSRSARGVEGPAALASGPLLSEIPTSLRTPD